MSHYFSPTSFDGFNNIVKKLLPVAAYTSRIFRATYYFHNHTRPPCKNKIMDYVFQPKIKHNLDLKYNDYARHFSPEKHIFFLVTKINNY